MFNFHMITKRVTNSHKSIIDLTLTNKQNSFQKTMPTETGLSDFHKLVFFYSHYSRLNPKTVFYKNFNNSNFLKDLSISTLLIPTTPMKITIS